MTHQKILEENGKIPSSAHESTSKPQRRSPVRHWRAWLAGACTSAAAVFIVCAVFLTPVEKHVVYYEKDIQSSESSFEALNPELKDFQIELGEDVIVMDIKRTIDEPSGDLLYYKMQLQTTDDLVHTSVTIICNRDCNYDPLPQELTFEQTQLSDYAVQYYMETSIDPTFLCQNITAFAKIEGESEIIYFANYNELAFEEGGTLFEFIQNLVRVKR